ncbi:MAG: ribonuclease III [Candidatus Buchananbacteria bacterium RIFCSPHIGHO2_01_FULL_47_11b]|uniref:Ribonuclease 3 n=1 Tax=Candidatus Buchananbacteria bacterium RIFCSPHIGHO2_01_FULL_47_11b TaxID=1797537 RepID=A0A1G1Y2X0_9BACT|nr:MAG: ribonuclease III [Candidatus Buchananbacteria bacterium RIFCSPHIGHO2_01_FULL_47_11b]
MTTINRLEKKIGITFSKPELLKQALVHRSYLNEHPDFELGHNERLEFLGDAVLELVVTENLYNNYPNPEGELTNWRASLVNSQMLATIAHKLNIEQFLYLSRGESKDTNSKARDYILANAVEAIVGAAYLDGGYEKAKKFVSNHLLPELSTILANHLYVDPKSKFQEIAQERLRVTPNYRVLEETGPDHDKKFEIGVYLDGDLIAKGNGTSKQEAQLDAATAALKAKNW